LYYLSWFLDAQLTAAFGISISCFAFFWMTFTQVNCECMAVYTTQCFEGKAYKKMRIYFASALILNFIITIFCCVVYYNMDKILIFVWFEPELSRLARD
jgi:Na+-driven multidrug efflux pump